MTEEEKAKAMRKARVICSDIALYNEKKIIKGIETDTFFDILKDELNEGRESYRSQIGPAIADKTNFFDRAILDVILKPKAHIKSKIW